MKVTKDSHVDYSSSTLREKIPVLDLAASAPLAGSIALSTPTITPYYANGVEWLPFGGSGILESGMIGLLDNLILFDTDGAYHQVLFDTDMSPPTPPHPSFTIDVPNSQIVINTDGNYLLYYNLVPGNTGTASPIQPEIYVSQMISSATPPRLAFTQVNGSFRLNSPTIDVPFASAAEGLAYVKLSGMWSGFLPSGTTVNTSLAITSSSITEPLFGEGGRSQYMGIVRIA